MLIQGIDYNSIVLEIENYLLEKDTYPCKAQEILDFWKLISKQLFVLEKDSVKYYYSNIRQRTLMEYHSKSCFLYYDEIDIWDRLLKTFDLDVDETKGLLHFLFKNSYNSDVKHGAFLNS